MKKSKIAGIAFNVPDNIVTNHDIEKMMDTTDEWIQTRSGIRARRWVLPGTPNSDLALPACVKAIENAGISPNDIDAIIVGTVSSDYNFPGMGPIIQRKLGIKKNIPAYDISAACSAFIYLLEMGDQYIKSGMYENILVVGSEIHSGGLDKSSRGRSVSVIFGDGAGAAVVSATDSDSCILSTHLHSEGKFAEELAVIKPATTFWIDKIVKNDDDKSYFPYMNGNFVFKNAVVRFEQVIFEALNYSNLKTEDINLLITHQANLRISQYIQKRLKLTDSQVFNNIMKYGNTTAASIPIALTEAYQSNLIKKGDIVVLAAFGSGFTWGSALIKW